MSFASGDRCVSTRGWGAWRRDALHEQDDQHDYEQGDIIRSSGGDYQVLGVLGSGGMGAVYLVKDRNIGKKFVLKVLHGWLAHRHDLKDRFEQEARALGHLSHEGIIEIFRLGRTADTRMPYYLMEVLSGETLGDALRRHGRLALFPALGISIKMLYALQHAHERGVIHRDIKPDNVFLHQGKSSEPVVKLIDFGILKLTAAAEDPNVFIGTPRYAAPEQLAGRVIGPKADLYSAGVVLFQLLAGRLPFERHGGGLAAMIETLALNAPALAEHGTFPPELTNLIASALEKDPDRRPADAFTFASALQRIRRSFAPDRKDVHAHVTEEVIATTGAPATEPSQITLAHLAAPTDPDPDMEQLIGALEEHRRDRGNDDSVSGYESTAEAFEERALETNAGRPPRTSVSTRWRKPARSGTPAIDREASTVLSGIEPSVGEKPASLPGAIRYVTHEGEGPRQGRPKAVQQTVPMEPARPIRQRLTAPMSGHAHPPFDDARTPEPHTTKTGMVAMRRPRAVPIAGRVPPKVLVLAGLVSATLLAAGARRIHVQETPSVKAASVAPPQLVRTTPDASAHLTNTVPRSATTALAADADDAASRPPGAGAGAAPIASVRRAPPAPAVTTGALRRAPASPVFSSAPIGRMSAPPPRTLASAAPASVGFDP